MSADGSGLCQALGELVMGSHLSGADQLPELVRTAGSHLGAADALLLLVDYDQVLLVPMGAARKREPVAVEGTLAGRAFTDVAPQVRRLAGTSTLWVPVVDGVERLGVLELTFDRPGPPAPADVTAELARDAVLVAKLVAELVITRSAYGDAIELTRRRLPMSVPAELQWNLLPPLTFALPRLAVAGGLAPTNEVAGDTFDYAVNGDLLHLAVFDAMGHGLEALLLATVTVGAFRSARRCGLGLPDTVRSIDRHLTSQFGEDKFVTGILGELDVSTGLYRWITCGHPPALLLRQGRVVKALEAAVNPPLALLGSAPQVSEERLQPGDRLLLYTDGVTEARDAAGEFFGTDRLVDLVVRSAAAGRPAPETLRRLTLAILAHQEGQLQDDATTLLVEWAGDEPRRLVP